MNQFVAAETNKIAAIVIKLLEHFLGHGHAVWMDKFYKSPELVRFVKSKSVGTLCANRKSVPPAVSKKLKKGEHWSRILFPLPLHQLFQERNSIWKQWF